jgi:hypothetical protein
MKNLLLTKLIFGFIMVLLMTGVALAGNSASITVSCVIPLMPGLNAPLIEENELRAQADTKAEQKIETQKENPETAPEMIQQDTQKETVSITDKKTPMIVKTYYCR